MLATATDAHYRGEHQAGGHELTPATTRGDSAAMNNLAEISNWCQQRLPETGLSSATTLCVAALLSIFAGYCLLKAARRTIVVGIVAAIMVSFLGSSQPATAVSAISCPAGYEVYPQSAKMAIEFNGTVGPNPTDQGGNTATFVLNVDLNGGIVYQPFTVEITGTALDVASPIIEVPTLSSGAGWAVKPKGDNLESGVYLLTYTPTGATTKLPTAEVSFDVATNDLQPGGTWTLSATAAGIPANTASATASYPFRLYDRKAGCGPAFVNEYRAWVYEGQVVESGGTIVSGTPPYKYVAEGLTGYTMAEDGTITWLDAPEGDTTFTVTVTDSAGASFTVPADIIYSATYVYIPDTC